MSNQQISTLALVLADLSDLGHVNSTLNFVNVSGKNYINVFIGDVLATIHGDEVQVFSEPKTINFNKFLSELINITSEKEVFDGN